MYRTYSNWYGLSPRIDRVVHQYEASISSYTSPFHRVNKCPSSTWKLKYQIKNISKKSFFLDIYNGNIYIYGSNARAKKATRPDWLADVKWLT